MNDRESFAQRAFAHKLEAKGVMTDFRMANLCNHGRESSYCNVYCNKHALVICLSKVLAYSNFALLSKLCTIMCIANSPLTSMLSNYQVIKQLVVLQKQTHLCNFSLGFLVLFCFVLCLLPKKYKKQLKIFSWPSTQNMGWEKHFEQETGDKYYL